MKKSFVLMFQKILQMIGLVSTIYVFLVYFFSAPLLGQNPNIENFKSKNKTEEAKKEYSPFINGDPRNVNFTMTAGAIGANVSVSVQVRSHKVFTDKLFIGNYDAMKLHLNLLNLLKDKGIITLKEGQAVINNAVISVDEEMKKLND